MPSNNERVEIRIKRSGDMKVEAKGFKGKACMKETEWVDKLLKGKKTGKTPDYYVPDEESEVHRRH